jgi:cbb3-type cytochrome oxidase subunit 3
MTDVIFVGSILFIMAIGVIVWLATRQKKGEKVQTKMPSSEFFVTVLGLMNSFIVVVLGILYLYGTQIRQSWLLAVIFMILGIAGIVFAYINKFRKRKLSVATKKK